MIETDFGMEINAVRHCTNACVACNHASTKFTEHYFMDPSVLARDLDKIKHLLRVKIFFIQGGEPLLHPKVIELLRLIHASGIARQCGVLTNGKLLPKMKEEFWKALAETESELRLSCYPDLSPDIVPFAQGKAAEYGFAIRPQEINSFKPIFQKNNGDTYYGCPWNRCLTLHEGFFYLCPLTAFFPKQFMGLPETIDGIPLEGLDEPSLKAFFDKDKPLETCKICSGARGEPIAWHQNNSKEEWEREAGLKEALA